MYDSDVVASKTINADFSYDFRSSYLQRLSGIVSPLATRRSALASPASPHIETNTPIQLSMDRARVKLTSRRCA